MAASWLKMKIHFNYEEEKLLFILAIYIKSREKILLLSINEEEELILRKNSKGK